MANSLREHLIVVGLGNPGKKYTNTRHNIGYLVVERLAEQFAVPLKEIPKFTAYVAKASIAGVTIHLVQPTTYMNLSGQAVRKYLGYYKLTVDDLIVITDDVALPFKEIRLRLSGSSGGHNGLKSIESCLGTSGYKRLRLGIENPQIETTPLEDFVLNDFSSIEKEELSNFIEQAAKVINRLAKEEPGRVMNDVNKKVRKSPEQGEEKNNET